MLLLRARGSRKSCVLVDGTRKKTNYTFSIARCCGRHIASSFCVALGPFELQNYLSLGCVHLLRSRPQLPCTAHIKEMHFRFLLARYKWRGPRCVVSPSSPPSSP